MESPTEDVERETTSKQHREWHVLPQHRQIVEPELRQDDGHRRRVDGRRFQLDGQWRLCATRSTPTPAWLIAGPHERRRAAWRAEAAGEGKGARSEQSRRACESADVDGAGTADLEAQPGEHRQRAPQHGAATLPAATFGRPESRHSQGDRARDAHRSHRAPSSGCHRRYMPRGHAPAARDAREALRRAPAQHGLQRRPSKSRELPEG